MTNAHRAAEKILARIFDRLMHGRYGKDSDRVDEIAAIIAASFAEREKAVGELVDAVEQYFVAKDVHEVGRLSDEYDERARVRVMLDKNELSLRTALEKVKEVQG